MWEFAQGKYRDCDPASIAPRDAHQVTRKRKLGDIHREIDADVVVTLRRSVADDLEGGGSVNVSSGERSELWMISDEDTQPRGHRRMVAARVRLGA